MLNGLDLFSGIGGLTLALAPWVWPVAYCENDRYAQSVLLARMAESRLPNAPIWDDVRTLPLECLPRVDIIYGGFPCQDISVAGDGAGLAGQRSGLVFEIFRIAAQTEPTFIFLENVPAIRTRGAERVGKELASLGYDCRWRCLSAREVGASFEGVRWFLLAAKTDRKTLWLKSWRCRGESRSATPLDSSTCDVGLTPWTPERGFESRVFGAGNGIPHAVDRDRCLGNAVVPLQARTAFERLIGFTEAIGEVRK